VLSLLPPRTAAVLQMDLSCDGHSCCNESSVTGLWDTNRRLSSCSDGDANSNGSL
jgi:hypothetical protein